MRKLLGIVTTLLVGATTAVFLTPGTAAADPSSADWAALRQCESGGNYRINTGNGYYGAYQFDLSTWRSVGGAGRPDQASAAEQNFRALYLYRMRGWAPWVCAALVGLREDSDGGSGVKPTRGASSCAADRREQRWREHRQHDEGRLPGAAVPRRATTRPSWPPGRSRWARWATA